MLLHSKQMGMSTFWQSDCDRRETMWQRSAPNIATATSVTVHHLAAGLAAHHIWQRMALTAKQSWHIVGRTMWAG